MDFQAFASADRGFAGAAGKTTVSRTVWLQQLGVQSAASSCAMGQSASIARMHRGHAARAAPLIAHAVLANVGDTPSTKTMIAAANWDARFTCFETNGKIGAQSVCCITLKKFLPRFSDYFAHSVIMETSSQKSAQFHRK